MQTFIILLKCHICLLAEQCAHLYTQSVKVAVSDAFNDIISTTGSDGNNGTCCVLYGHGCPFCAEALRSDSQPGCDDYILFKLRTQRQKTGLHLFIFTQPVFIYPYGSSGATSRQESSPVQHCSITVTLLHYLFIWTRADLIRNEAPWASQKRHLCLFQRKSTQLIKQEILRMVSNQLKRARKTSTFNYVRL